MKAGRGKEDTPRKPIGKFPLFLVIYSEEMESVPGQEGIQDCNWATGR